MTDATDSAAAPSGAVRPLLEVHQTRSFTGKPVAADVLDAIADAARWSGSSRNSQPWRFVIVRSVETIRALGQAGLPSTVALTTATAAIAIVLPEASGKGISFAFDEGRAAERMLVAASLSGLGAGIVWLVPDARRVAAKLLEIPADRFVRTVVALGLPSAEGQRSNSPPGQARLPRDEVVFYERFGGTISRAGSHEADSADS